MRSERAFDQLLGFLRDAAPDTSPECDWRWAKSKSGSVLPCVSVRRSTLGGVVGCDHPWTVGLASSTRTSAGWTVRSGAEAAEADEPADADWKAGRGRADAAAAPPDADAPAEAGGGGEEEAAAEGPPRTRKRPRRSSWRRGIDRAATARRRRPRRDVVTVCGSFPGPVLRISSGASYVAHQARDYVAGSRTPPAPGPVRLHRR